MVFWRKRKQSAKKAAFSTLCMEKLEDRAMMAVIPIVSGQATTFHDADGTRVTVMLTGPGQGSLELTNGLLTDGAIDSLTLTGTTGESKLHIGSRGGSIRGTTINELIIDKAANQPDALKSLIAKKVYFTEGGQLDADGNIGKVHIGDIGAEVNVVIEGGVDKFKTRSLQPDAIVDVDGTLKKFVAEMLQAGSAVVADQIDHAKIKRYAEGASIEVGEGGIGKVTAQQFYDSSIAAEGYINKVVVYGNMMGSSVAGNLDPGSDGMYGTIDDFAMSSTSDGNVGMVKVHGRMGASDTNQSSVVAYGAIDEVRVGGKDARTMVNAPTITEFAASDFITLDIEQAVAEATGYGDDEIWIAVFGTETGSGLPGNSYYLDASNIKPSKQDPSINNPVPKVTSTLYTGPDTPGLAILPSSTIQQWGNNLRFPVPAAGNQYSGRIVISVGAPVQAQVVQATGGVSAPSAASTTDPSSGTFYDFIEFTAYNPISAAHPNGLPSLDIDTSQVDSFGMPMKLELFKNGQGTETFDFTFQGSTTNLSKSITGVTNIGSLGNGMAISGPGLQDGTVITNIDGTTNTVTINHHATVTSSGPATLTGYPGGPIGVEADRDVIFNGGSPLQLLAFIESQITAQNYQARPFLQSAAPYETIGAKPILGVTNPQSGNIVVSTYSVAGMQNGDHVTISGVGGNTNANGTFVVSAVDSTANTFEIPVSGSGGYTGGGTWTWSVTGTTLNGSVVTILTDNTTGLNDGDLVEVTGVQGTTGANGLFIVSDVVTGTSFTLTGSEGSGTWTSGGTWSAYSQNTNRLVSPKDIVEALLSPQDPNLLNNYFNEVIDAFFLNYFTGTTVHNHVGNGNPFSLTSTASGKLQTYSGSVTNTNTNGGGYVLRLTSSDPLDTNNYDIYYPFFDSNAPAGYTPAFGTSPAPSWLGNEIESASQMVFACDQVFADNTLRTFNSIPTTSGVPSTILADLENSLSAAFNRGIALNDSTTWDQYGTWFQQNSSQASMHGFQAGTYNYWAEFWHQQNLMISDLAYAFPYDDKFGASTNINLSGVEYVKVTLGNWADQSTVKPTTTAFTVIPTTGTQGGPVTITAQVTGTNTPTGTLSFFINGLPINPDDASSTPPQYPIAIDNNGIATVTANLPALTDGSVNHTYTVTAVYSGDATNMPSVAYNNSLALTGVNGDFLLNFTPGSVAVNTATTVTAQLPGDDFDGTIALSISKSDGSGSQSLGSFVPTTINFSQSVTIPQDLLTFTGTFNGTNVVDVSSVVDLVAGQVLTGTGIPANTTIQSMGPGPLQITLNPNPGNYPTGPVTVTSNGQGAVFPITAVFTPTVGGPFTATALFPVSA
jgi:hypothetical protein